MAFARQIEASAARLAGVTGSRLQNAQTDLTRSFAVKPSAISAGNNKSACPSRSMISDFMRRHLLACALKKADEHGARSFIKPSRSGARRARSRLDAN
jgi:hypothetical protein